jgi:hypothetical protein
MSSELKEKWLAALRSGHYRQGNGRLHQYSLDGDCYCCLGVLADVIDPDSWEKAQWGGRMWRGREGFVSVEFLPIPFQTGLIRMNDYGGNTFTKIADWIEANVEGGE